MKQKRMSLVTIVVTVVLAVLLIYFIKPNKLYTYLKAKYGVENNVLVYTLSKKSDQYEQNKSELNKFLINRGISGTAYKDEQKEYYVTLVPTYINPTTEKSFGFEEVSPENFYKKVYSADQVYFTRTLRIIQNN